jgi:hypothetical protein
MRLDAKINILQNSYSTFVQLEKEINQNQVKRISLLERTVDCLHTMVEVLGEEEQDTLTEVQKGIIVRIIKQVYNIDANDYSKRTPEELIELIQKPSENLVSTLNIRITQEVKSFISWCVLMVHSEYKAGNKQILFSNKEISEKNKKILQELAQKTYRFSPEFLSKKEFNTLIRTYGSKSYIENNCFDEDEIEATDEDVAYFLLCLEKIHNEYKAKNQEELVVFTEEEIKNLEEATEELDKAIKMLEEDPKTVKKDVIEDQTVKV